MGLSGRNTARRERWGAAPSSSATDEVEEPYLIPALVNDVAKLHDKGRAHGLGDGERIADGPLREGLRRDEAGEAERGEGLGEVSMEV
ncbi:hypothetical protein E2562_016869 [Oryza meyeriana var. granulata]|uniref:Uncharacterized protein n=1 Tax=Oryza meyeriana var. granulata TaxID=110450 RepID=A0A6G1BYX0_9ORYZ|nr:hypothetical protein E2562_016869 [Oryza meyeriana var. granulata]